MRFRSPSLRSLAAVGLVGAALFTLSCDDDGGTSDPAGPGTPGNLTITCGVSSSTIPAGSTGAVTVTATVARDGAGVPGQTVVFSTTIGAVSPDVVVTDAFGQAQATFRPSGQAGLAVITTRVFASNPQDQVGTTCTVNVTGATDPLLTVSVLVPQQLGGIEITVTYDPTEVTLPTGGAVAQGGFGGFDCLVAEESPVDGVVRLNVACGTNRTVGGTAVATFAFQNDGFGTLDEGDFFVQCKGFTAPGGVEVLTTCSELVTQL